MAVLGLPATCPSLWLAPHLIASLADLLCSQPEACQAPSSGWPTGEIRYRSLGGTYKMEPKLLQGRPPLPCLRRFLPGALSSPPPPVRRPCFLLSPSPPLSSSFSLSLFGLLLTSSPFPFCVLQGSPKVMTRMGAGGSCLTTPSHTGNGAPSKGLLLC